MSGTYHTYAVTIRLPHGNYVTINVTAVNQVAAHELARSMGGEVSCIRQID